MAVASLLGGLTILETCDNGGSGGISPIAPLASSTPIVATNLFNGFGTGINGTGCGTYDPQGSPSAGALMGGIYALAGSVDLSVANRLAFFHYFNTDRVTDITVDTGLMFYINSGSLGTEEAAFAVNGGNNPISSYNCAVVNLNRSADAHIYSGSFDPSDVTHMGSATNFDLGFSQVNIETFGYVDPIIVINGEVGNKGDFSLITAHTTSNNTLLSESPTENIHHCFYAWGVGDGSTETHFAETLKVWEFTKQVDFSSDYGRAHINDNDIGFELNASANCVISYELCSWITENAQYWRSIGSTSGTVSYTSCVTKNSGGDTILVDGHSLSLHLFDSCGPIQANAPTMANCTIKNALTHSIDLGSGGGANITSLLFVGNQTAVRVDVVGNATLDVTEFTFDSSNTFFIEYTGTGTLTVTASGSIPGGKLNASGGGTITVVAPILTLNINSDTAATLIRYFEDDSQTVVDSTTGVTLGYDFPDTDPIDIELVKQSYVPINRQNVTPFDGDFDSFMDFDESYNSGHGLTITSEYDYVRATKVLTINSDQNALNVRSSLADVIRTNSSYFNTPLLMVSIPGLTRVDLTDGVTITSMATWKGAGMERFDSADSLNPLEKWAAIKSVGTITGATTHFRQTDSGNSTALALTNNVVDEALQYWDDPDHDGVPATDTSDYLLIKAFLAGSKQARVDVLVNAGVSELASNLFTVPMANADHGYSGSDPGVSGDLTLIAGGTFGGKTFAYEIVDGGVNTGADVADQFNFNAASNPNTVIPGGTGLRYFELNDMVVHNASAVETERGFQEGTTPVLVGFYASQGGSDHPGFTRFQADDGTYFTPAVTSNVAVTGMPTAGNEIRLQIYNVTAQTASAWGATTAYSQGVKALRSTGLGTEQTAGLYFVATTAGTSGGSEPAWDTTVGNTTADGTVTWTTFAILFHDADPVGTGFADSYTDGEEFITGDVARVRFSELNTTTSFKQFDTTVIVSSTGFAVAVDASANPVYASNGIDGSSTAVTDIFTADYVNNEIDLDTNMDFTHPKAFAFVCFEQTTSQGMFQIWDIVTAVDAGNYRNNVDILGILFDETLGFVKQEDGDTSRWFRSDGLRPFKDPTTGGNGISMNWKNPVFTISTGSVLTAAQDSELFKNTAILADTADMQPKLGTPVDTDISTDIANVQTAVDAGGGGGGDATEAKQDEILTKIDAGQGTGFDTSTDSLESIRDRGDEAWTTFDTPPEIPEPPVV